MSQKKVIFIDPMSYNNLAEYDYMLLSNIKNFNILFLGNRKFEFDYPQFNAVFNYNANSFFLFKAISYILSMFHISFKVLRFKPDIIHLQWFKIPLVDLFFLKALKLLSRHTKFIFTAHNILPHNTGLKYRESYQRLYDNVDQVIVHALATKQELINMFRVDEKKISVINHGILTQKKNDGIQNIQLLNNFREKFNSKNKRVFLFIGTISKYKGIDILWEAWHDNDFIENNDKSILIIAGKGSFEDVDIQKKADNIYIENRFLTDEEFLAYVEIADVIVFPYREISQSGVLLTALHHKKNIIVSNKGGLSEPLKFGKIGWQFNIGETQELKAIIQNIILQNNYLTEYNRDDQWKNVLNQYCWESIGSHTQGLYETIIQ